jgi:tRNA(Ile)-lysidine synthase
VTVRLESDENIVKKLKFNNLFTICVMDYDKIKGQLILRNRRFGDRIRPFGKSFHVSVKKWLQSAVKKEDRKYIHFICDEEGLAAVQGLGTAARLAPDKNTKNFLVIEFAKDFEEEK